MGIRRRGPYARRMKPSLGVPSIPPAEYRARRERVLAELGRAVGIVLAGEASAHGFRADPNFAYLTGLTGEAGAAVLFDPSNPDPRRRILLFLRPLNPEMEVWDGYRDPISTALRQRCGFDTVMRTTLLPRMLTQAVRLSKRGALLHALAVYDAPVSPDLALLRRVMERVPGVGIEDRSELLPSLRAIKSKAEVAIMRHAIAVTSAGYDAALGVIRPGASEHAVQRALERTWQDLGADGPAYESIVGGGINGTVLHYKDNSGTLKDGDLLVIDAGCSFAGYASDITRTYPVNGKFTKRQRELYDLVLGAQLASIRAVRPGVWMHEVDEAARKVFRRAGLEDKYLHGIGHQLGLETHDASPIKKLEAGMVITIEPGLYLPEERTGIRIEDDVLVTPRGAQILSPRIAKRAKDVEGEMAEARRGPALRARRR